MSHTYAHNPVHVVFSTKERRKPIPKESQAGLWAYRREFARSKGFSCTKSEGWKTTFTC